ncbi:MAG: polysaccharide biosynthesis/export family protein [Pseudomonadota bacterium]
MPRIFPVRTSTLMATAGLAVTLSLAGCVGSGNEPLLDGSDRTLQGHKIEPAASGSNVEYRLGTGDKLRIIVYGEPDLSGEFVIDGGGVVDLPLIGKIKAKGSTLRQFQERAVASYRNGYLNDPKVSAEVLNYRPFFITGEIKQGGQYPYRSGLTAQDAIAIAGGYTYRANVDKIYIRREGRDKEVAVSLKRRVMIVPGDNIRIPERFF